MVTPSRQNNFNLIRLVFAVLVLLAHSPEIVDGNRDRELLSMLGGVLSLGDLAVDGFFLLSGYLILQSWHGQPQAWPFLRKRMLRIYPGFLVASVLCIVLVGPLGAADAASYFANLDVPNLLSEAVLLLTPTLPAVFEGTHYANTNIPLWSISREFQCYALILALGLTGALKLRHFWLALTAVVVARFLYLKLNFAHVDDLRLLLFFMCGGCFYAYRDKIRLSGKTALLLLLPIAIGIRFGRVAEIMLCTAGAYVLFYAALTYSTLLSNFNRLPDVSYGVYLYGWPIQKLLLLSMPTLSPWALFALTTPLALLMGGVSWYLVEKPCLRLNRRRRTDKQGMSTASALAEQLQFYPDADRDPTQAEVR